MRIRIVCPVSCAYEGDAAFVSIPSTDGEFGVLPAHSSEICTIATVHADKVKADIQGFEEKLGNLSEDDARRAYLYNEIAWCKLKLAQ